MPRSAPAASLSADDSEDAAFTPDTGASDLDERYGTSRRRGVDRRFAWIVGAVLGIAGICFFVFATGQQTSTIETRDLDYSVESDQKVSVRFEVTANTDKPVACAVEALNQGKAVVGWKVIDLPNTNDRSHTVSTSLVTTSRATTGHAKSCWIAGD